MRYDAVTATRQFIREPRLAEYTQMNGQLSEQPPAELIREISAKNLSGRLRLHHQRLAVVIYFKFGKLIYAASNVHALRLREYLIKDPLISEAVLTRFEGKRSDLDLANALVTDRQLTLEQADQLQLRQVCDVLRLSLLWIEGTWEFDNRSQLNEEVHFKIDSGSLLLEAGRKTPAKFAAARFRNPGELISPSGSPGEATNLQPQEAFILSRLEGPTALNDLVALSGLEEEAALQSVYTLALAGLIQREHWKSAFRNESPKTPPPSKPKKEIKSASPTSETPDHSFVVISQQELHQFLDRLNSADSHYGVLGIRTNASPSEIKDAYYDLARRYHPDRFRKESDVNLQARLDSAFARITQAYDTLRDGVTRATYDSKLNARAKARELSDTAPKAAETATTTTHSSTATADSEKPAEPQLSNAERAEINFKDGFAATQLGQANVAIGLFASAARLVPDDARYRAYYGQALAANETTRRLAETELLAAVKIDPNNADYRTMLAELYRDLGFAIRARSEVERALGFSPNHQKARELLRSLK